MTLALQKNLNPQSTVTEPTHNAMRVEGLISFDAIEGISRQSIAWNS
jgi:hypothetical protein